MDLEIEVKILEVDEEEVLERIEKLGGKKINEGVLKSYYFDFQENRLKDAVVRVREYGNEVFMDYKRVEKKSDYKEANEVKVKIDSFEKGVEFLESIGMVKVKELVKRRISFKLLNSLVEIDKIDGIPTFLEIEGKKEEIEKIISLLGLENKKRTSFTTEELFSYYGKKF